MSPGARLGLQVLQICSPSDWPPSSGIVYAFYEEPTQNTRPDSRDLTEGLPKDGLCDLLQTRDRIAPRAQICSFFLGTALFSGYNALPSQERAQLPRISVLS